MRKTVLRAGVLIALSLTAYSNAISQDPDEIKIRASDLGHGVHMLVGSGGNIGVLSGTDGVLLIDDQFARLTEKIRDAVAGISDQPIRFVINTHWHGDHTGGNANMARAGAVLVAHENVRRRLTQGLAERDTPPAPDEALPIVTFEDSITFHINGQTVKVFHVPPSHTDGDSMVYFEQADVLHTGDIYFNGLYPFIDAASGGSIDGVIDAVERGLKIAGPSTRIIPGHGPLSGYDDFKVYGEMLKTVRKNMAGLIEAGQGIDKIVEAKPTADFDEMWGKGFLSPERFVRTVYEGMQR